MQIPGSELSKFISLNNPGLSLGQSIPVHCNKIKKRYPDIVIEENNVLKAIVQITIYITGGMAEIDREIESLDMIQGLHKELRVLIAIYSGPSLRSRQQQLLDEKKTDRPWFDYVILQDNNTRLYSVLDRHLLLRALATSIPSASAQ